MTIDINFLIDHPIAIGVGLLVSVLLGFLLKPILRSITSGIHANPPSDFKPFSSPKEGEDPAEFRKREWKRAVAPPDEVAGWWLGALERAVFFLAVAFQAFTVIFAWLAFKVASKWSVWQNIVKVPDSPEEKLELGPRARRALGSNVMQRFLVGTLFNILAAFLSWILVLAIAR